jgi:hypothetical protein
VHAGAASDEALHKALHHIMTVQRFFPAIFLKRQCDMQ